MDISYRVVRSNRRTVAIQITPSGEVVVRCPRHMPIRTVESFVASKTDWIEKHLIRKVSAEPMPPEQVKAFAAAAKADFPARVARFAANMGVEYGRITVRAQRSRWGSCSGKGNLNFNCLLMLAPETVRDYVVVHELCHRRQMNHSSQFWAEVERVLPDYRESRKWLKNNGPALIARLP